MTQTFARFAGQRRSSVDLQDSRENDELRTTHSIRAASATMSKRHRRRHSLGVHRGWHVRRACAPPRRAGEGLPRRHQQSVLFSCVVVVVVTILYRICFLQVIKEGSKFSATPKYLLHVSRYSCLVFPHKKKYNEIDDFCFTRTKTNDHNDAMQTSTFGNNKKQTILLFGDIKKFWTLCDAFEMFISVQSTEVVISIIVDV